MLEYARTCARYE